KQTHGQRREPAQISRAALSRERRRPLFRPGRRLDQSRSRLRLRQLRHLPHAAPRQEYARRVDEPGPKRPADLHEILGAGQELPGGGELRPASAGVHAFVHKISLRPLGDGDLRRIDRQAAGSVARADHRAADSRVIGDRHRRRDSAGVLWDQLESAGIQDIAGVYNHTSYLTVVSIKQKYAGHAKQAGTAALSCAAANRNGRYVVVVDEDIDPTNIKEVLWAMMTRVDPPTNIDIIDGCWSTPLDPRMPPEKRDNKDHTNGRAIFYAVRPFAWKEKFPKVSRSSRDLREKTIAKFKNIIPFPGV